METTNGHTGDFSGNVADIARYPRDSGPVAVGTGLISLDIVFPNADKTGANYWAGGTCGNVLAILAYFGWRAYPVGILGVDEAGALVEEDIRRVGVRTRFLGRDHSHNTPIVVEEIRQSARGLPRHRFIWTCPNCGSRLPRYRPLRVSQARMVTGKLSPPAVFFFDRVSRGSLHLAEAFAAQGTLIVFEPSNVGQAKLFQEAVSLSHIVKYSHERLGHLRLPAYPAPLLEIETLGDAGLRYRLRDANRQTLSQWMLVPAYAVNSARDTAGAGDWCTGGIIHILGTNGSEGFNIAVEKNISLALRFGQALAALKCGYQGARGVMYALKRRHFDQEVQRIVAREQMPASRDNSSLRLGETLASICPKCFQNRGCTK